MEAENQESPAAHCAVGRQDAGKPPKSSIMTLLSHAACVSEEPVRPMKRLKLHEADGGCGYAGVRQPVPESLKSDFRDVPCGLLAAVFESSHFNVTQTRSLMKKLVEEEQEVQQVRCSRKRTHAGRQIPEDAFSREPQAIVEGVLDCTSAEHRHSVLAQMIMQQMVSSNSQQAATEVLTQFLKAFERRSTRSEPSRDERDRDILSRAVRLLGREVTRLKNGIESMQGEQAQKDAMLLEAERGLRKLREVNARLASRLSELELGSRGPFCRYDDDNPPAIF